MGHQGGKVIIVSAPSGAGKTTIVKRILASHPDFVFSVSATTRPIRGNEKHGVDYFYLSEAEFRAKIAAGDFLEWEEVYPGRFYGSLKSEVERILSSGKSVLFDVDVKGGLNVKRHFGGQACSFFIAPPSLGVLRERLVNRGTDSAADIEKRLSKATLEMQDAPHFDHVIVNDDLERAVAEVESVLQSFISRS